MNRATAENTVIQAFKAWWATTIYAAIPVAYPDVDFTAPAPPASFARITVVWSGSVTAGAGDREHRHTGMVFVDLYWPSGTGYKDVNDAAEAVAEFCRGYTADTGRLQLKGIGDGARPYVSRAPSQPGFTRRTVNAPLRLMEAL